MNDMDTLYAINDALTALAADLRIRFTSEDDEDEALNEATHAVAAIFGLQPKSPRDRAAELLTDTDIAGILAGQEG